MRIAVDVEKFHDWKATPASELQPGDIHTASQLGESIRLKRVLVDEPSVTWVEIPDDLIERWHADHRQGVADALAGDPPRVFPIKSRNQLISDHLADAVMPYHAPAEHVRQVRIVESALPEAERQRLQRMLQDRLSATPDEAAEESE